MTLDKIKAAERIFACGGGSILYNLVPILFIFKRCATQCSAAHKESSLSIFYTRIIFNVYFWFVISHKIGYKFLKRDTKHSRNNYNVKKIRTAAQSIDEMDDGRVCWKRCEFDRA